MHLNVNFVWDLSAKINKKKSFLCFFFFQFILLAVISLSTFFDLNKRYWLLLHNENWCLKPTDTVQPNKRRLYHFSLQTDDWISLGVIQKLISFASPWKAFSKPFHLIEFLATNVISTSTSNYAFHDTPGYDAVRMLTHLHSHFTRLKWQLLIGK